MPTGHPKGERFEIQQICYFEKPLDGWAQTPANWKSYRGVMLLDDMMICTDMLIR